MPSAQEQPSDGTHPSEKTILIVEDDEAIAEIITLTISQETSHQTVVVPDGPRALNIIKATRPDLLILNYRLSDIMNGIEVYDRAVQERGYIPAIMISANLPQQETAQRQIVGLHKPFELDDLLATIEKLLA